MEMWIRIMHSFFCNTLGKAGEPVELAKRESDHLFKTLRAAPGDTVELLDGAADARSRRCSRDGCC